MTPQEPQNPLPQNGEPQGNPAPVGAPSEIAESSAPAAPSVGQVFAPGGVPPASVASDNNVQPPSPSPSLTPPPTPQVEATVPSQPSGTEPMMSASSMQAQDDKKKRGFKPSKKAALIALVPLVLLGGGAAAYFGYIVPNRPENVWKSALTNTGKGYDKLSSYATAKKNVQGMSAKGSFKISGSFAADGTFNGVSDGKNGQLTGDVSAVGLKINYDVREIESPSNSPDVYFKIDGIQGLGDLVGGYAGLLGGDSSQLTNTLNGLNGQWYFIDHTLFDQAAQGSNDGLQITSSDVSGALKAVGDSSKQYLFTSDPDKMAIVVKQNIGKEKQDGRTVYHYKVGINKTNLKAFNQSLCDNLIKTKLFKLFETNSSGDQDLSKECTDATGIDKIKDNQTADAWVDMRTKLFHKIRFASSENKNSYVDIIQDYQGGDEFPFSIATHSQESVDNNDIGSSKPATSDGLIKMKLNMKTNTFTMDAKFEDKSGSSDDKGTFNLTIAPSTQKVKVDKPAGAKTIIQLINDLGFGAIAGTPSSNPSTGGTGQDVAKDSKRKTDVNALQSQLEVYYANYGAYPTLANINDANWRKTNMPGFDNTILKDPDGTQSKLAASAAPKVYAYRPAPAGCNGSNCASYTLQATLSSGTLYTKQSLNQ